MAGARGATNPINFPAARCAEHVLSPPKTVNAKPTTLNPNSDVGLTAGCGRLRPQELHESPGDQKFPRCQPPEVSATENGRAPGVKPISKFLLN